MQGWQQRRAKPTAPRLQMEAVTQKKKVIGNLLGLVEHWAEFLLTDFSTWCCLLCLAGPESVIHQTRHVVCADWDSGILMPPNIFSYWHIRMSCSLIMHLVYHRLQSGQHLGACSSKHRDCSSLRLTAFISTAEREGGTSGAKCCFFCLNTQ